MNDLAEETEEQSEARVRAWRTREALRAAPELALHVRSLAVRAKTERGETLPEWTAPMQITAVGHVDDLFVRLLEWVGYWAEILEAEPPAVWIVAWRNFQDSHASAGHADAPVQGFKAGTSPEGAQALVRLLTIWLLLKADRIEAHPSVGAFQTDILEMVSQLRGRYPMAPRAERRASARPCPLCGVLAVHAEWLPGDDGEQVVEIRCQHCGQDVVEFVGGQRKLQRVLGWLS